MNAKKYSWVTALARPHRRKAAVAEPSALKSITHGYGNRSPRWPRTIWPATADELKIERETVAASGEKSARAKLEIYRETGKYEKPWRRSVRDWKVKTMSVQFYERTGVG